MRKSPNKYLLAIIVFTALSRLWRLDFPKSYVFDEVYHAFTAKQFLAGDIKAWEWWNTPPPGVAYEWTHPPLAKEIMALSMGILHTTSSWAWRLPGVLLGVLAVFLVYKIGQALFKNQFLATLAAFIFSLDGLNFVQSRTGMNDIYFVTFMLASVYFFIKKKTFYSAIFLGLSLASKWTTVYLYPVFIILLFLKREDRNWLRQITYLFLVPLIIYLISYLPFFIMGHSWDQFIELQKQMWWYHTNLKATHDYSSPWWSWPLNLYPVWYFVDYQGDKTANIFASGNPVIFWAGFLAVILSIWEYTKTRSKALLLILLGYFAFLLPWAFSPRIMFLYHYSPSVPFMSLALSYQLEKIYADKTARVYFYGLTVLMFLGFLVIYPFLTGIPLPKDLMLLFFRLNLTKNPFGG